MTDETTPPANTFTTFACQAGLMPLPGPVGDLIFAVAIGLWRGAAPRFSVISIRIERHGIVVETRRPLTPQQFAAIAAACAACDDALRPTDNKTPDRDHSRPGDHVEAQARVE